jgi:hypothetical protein
MQRLWYAMLGAGAHRLTKEERHELIDEKYKRELAAIREKYRALGEQQVEQLIAMTTEAA